MAYANSFKVGSINNVQIINSHSKANVLGIWVVGGLAGECQSSSTLIEGSYAIGNVNGVGWVGGLVGGFWGSNVSIINSYSGGLVTRTLGSMETFVSGFVGDNYLGNITNSYSIGRVIYEDAPDPTDKGFVGEQTTGAGWLDENNYFDMETSLQSSTTGNATGKTTAQMKSITTYTDWDIVDYDDFDEENPSVWYIREGKDYPKLYWQYEGHLIEDLPSNLSVLNRSTQLSLGTDGKKVFDEEINARVKYGEYLLSDIVIDMTANRDWSGVSGQVNASIGKSFVSGLTTAPGSASTHTLYIPIVDEDESEGVRICPTATSLTEVSRDCVGGVDFTIAGTKLVAEDSVTVSKETVDGNRYWKAEGVSGTGGMDLQPETEDDTIPPTGTISINTSSIYTNTPVVTLTLSASDNLSGVSQMMISNTSDFTGASWETYATTKYWTLPSGDGEKTVYAKFKDNAGNESTVVSDTIILKTSTILTLDLSELTYQETQERYTVSEGEDVIIKGTAEQNTKVTITALTEQGVVVYETELTVGADGTWELNLGETLGVGTYLVQISTTDPAGNVAYSEFTLEITEAPEPLPQTGEHILAQFLIGGMLMLSSGVGLRKSRYKVGTM